MNLMDILFSIVAFLQIPHTMGGSTYGYWWCAGPENDAEHTIIQATTTLQVPDVPQAQTGVLDGTITYFPGLLTHQGIVMTSVIAYANPQAYCNASDGQWCVIPSTYYDDKNGQVNSYPNAPALPGDMVTIEYNYDPGSLTYNQSFYINGVLKSASTSETGPGSQWCPSTDCNAGYNGEIPQTYWMGSRIVFDQPLDTLPMSWPGSGGNPAKSLPETQDNGASWLLEELILGASSCTAM
ncbi:MAG: hypothetical protein M1822_002657 [Bathelium mastoideum]|nr:MAG: hypothetical protein M1822_002657 [Bathelium mastoideum]